MFDKFGIITPIKKNNYNIEEEVLKYFNSLINKTNYNYTLLHSQIYSYNQSLKECFQNILLEHSNYFIKMLENDMNKINIIMEFMNSLPKQLMFEFEECLINNMNTVDNYYNIALKYIQLEDVIMNNDIKKYFSFTKFEETYCALWIAKLANCKKAREMELSYNFIFLSVNDYYASKIHPSCKNIILLMIEKIINFIKSIPDEKLKIKTSYDFNKKVHGWFHKATMIDHDSTIKYINMRNEISDIYYDAMKKYFTECFTNINDKKFEELNKIMFYCSNIQNETKTLEENKNYYFKYIVQNISKKNIYKFIANALGNLNNVLEDLIIVLEKKLKGALLNLKYDKFEIIISDYKNILNKIQSPSNKNDPLYINIDKTVDRLSFDITDDGLQIKMQPYIYDFVKQLTNLISIYDIKNKDKEFRKVLTLPSDTFVHKFDIDDIYLNDFNHMNKLIHQITKDNIYISKEQSMIIVEIIKDGKTENVKLNMNQYMILLSLENNIENNVDVLKKGYGTKNVDYLIQAGHIEINNNIVKKLMNS